MDYATTLQADAASKGLSALAERVRKLERQRAAVEDRIKNERENLARTEEHIASFKSQAAEKLARGTSAYQEFLGRLRRLKLEVETAKEALALLDAETRPAVEKELWETRGKLSQALDALCLAARPAAEARMAELLGAVVSEHDEFLGGCARLFLDHGLVFTPPPRYSGPRVEHARFAHFGKRLLTSPMHYLAFSDPPATPAPQAAPVDVPDRQATPGATPTPAPDTGAAPVDENDRRNAPESTISAPSDAGAVLKEDAAAAPGVETSAQAASGRTISDGADTQTAPEGVCEKKGSKPTGNKASPVEEPAPQEVAPEKGTTLRTGATPGPAGMDPDAPPDLEAQDCASVDAEYQADLDAEAPPDAGKENLGIAAECA